MTTIKMMLPADTVIYMINIKIQNNLYNDTTSRSEIWHQKYQGKNNDSPSF